MKWVDRLGLTAAFVMRWGVSGFIALSVLDSVARGDIGVAWGMVLGCVLCWARRAGAEMRAIVRAEMKEAGR